MAVGVVVAAVELADTGVVNIRWRMYPHMARAGGKYGVIGTLQILAAHHNDPVAS